MLTLPKMQPVSNVPVFSSWSRLFHVVPTSALLLGAAAALAQVPNAGAKLPTVNCQTETGVMVCRAVAVAFVWCKAAPDLAALETMVELEPGRREAIVAAAAFKGQCGTSAGVVMNVLNRPERTLEGVLHPQISQKVFGQIAQVQAPATSKPICQGKGYCAVTTGPFAWGCPEDKDLSLVDDAKVRNRCIRIPQGSVGELWADDERSRTATLAFGYIQPPYSYRIPRTDLNPIAVSPHPTNVFRGWCRVGEWCVTAAPAVFCRDEPALERVLATPAGEARRDAVTGEQGCRILIRGDVMKPMYEGNPAKPVWVEHPVRGQGYTTTGAFKKVSRLVPTRVTSRLADLAINWVRSPSERALGISGQGSSRAVGAFRATQADFVADCKREHPDELAVVAQCVRRSMTGITRTTVVKADCPNKQLQAFDNVYKLRPLPKDASEVHSNSDVLSEVWQNTATEEWVDGSSASNEVGINSAFDALCPGVRNDASLGTVFRDPGAQFPREMQGVWFTDPKACADRRRNDPDYAAERRIVVQPRRLDGYEYHESANIVRQTGPSTWALDVSWSGEGEEGQSTVSYSVTREGLSVVSSERRMRWVRCPP